MNHEIRWNQRVSGHCLDRAERERQVFRTWCSWLCIQNDQAW